jgi:hypothetical protein
MRMSVEIGRIELTGLGDAASGRPGKSLAASLRSGFVWLSAALIAGVGIWAVLAFYAGKPAGSEPAQAATVTAGPAALSAVAPAPPLLAVDPPTAGGEAIVPEAPAVIDGLSIASQYWRRGGLGSNALVTFTLRNSNDYAVKDIAISCAFSRRDGSHLTDRSRVIHDIVNGRSRKTFVRLHVGFVNVNATKAKCAPIAARPA